MSTKNINMRPEGLYDSIKTVPVITRRRKYYIINYMVVCINTGQRRGILLTVSKLGDVLKWCCDNTFMAREINKANTKYSRENFLIVKGDIRVKREEKVEEVCKYIEEWLPKWISRRLICDAGLWDSSPINLQKVKTSGRESGGIQSGFKDAGSNMGRA